MNVRFYIERRKDGSGKLMMKERPVFMSASFRGKRVMIGTGMKVDFHSWDPERQRVRGTFPGAHTANAWLDTHVKTAEITWKAISGLREEISPAQFRKLFLKNRPRFSMGFFDVFYLFLESGLNRWTASTYQKVRTIYKHLREMEGETGHTIRFDQMNALFLNHFQEYYAKRGNSPATIRSAVGIIVWFLNWASGQGYNVQQDYRKFYRMLEPAGESSKEVQYLRWEELMRIRDFRSGNRKMDRIRDLFCFMCFTGIRFSEIRRLKKEDVKRDAVRVRSRKGELRQVPLNNRAGEIYRNYVNRYYLNNAAFPQMSVITMNKYLRRIAAGAGLTRPVRPFQGDGPDVPLCERITVGIAVNTFIANALTLDIPAGVVAGFTGVRNDSRIQRLRANLAEKEMMKFDLVKVTNPEQQAE